MIRKGRKEDLGRVAEILVFNNRINYYPIFKDVEYSFRDYNVLSLVESLGKDEDFLNGFHVYEDIVIKGFFYVRGNELVNLYTDPFFQSKGIGDAMICRAMEMGITHLWALEKNTRAIAFYERHGFIFEGEKKFEEDTTEYLVHMVKNAETV